MWRDDNHGLLLDRQHRRLRLSRAGALLSRGGSLPPLGDGLGVDAVALGKLPQARLTMLYRSTDRRCRCGAPMVNLSHSASFSSQEKTAPSNSGIKHLGSAERGTGVVTWIHAEMEELSH